MNVNAMITLWLQLLRKSEAVYLELQWFCFCQNCVSFYQVFPLFDNHYYRLSALVPTTAGHVSQSYLTGEQKREKCVNLIYQN